MFKKSGKAAACGEAEWVSSFHLVTGGGAKGEITELLRESGE